MNGWMKGCSPRLVIQKVSIHRKKVALFVYKFIKALCLLTTSSLRLLEIVWSDWLAMRWLDVGGLGVDIGWSCYEG